MLPWTTVKYRWTLDPFREVRRLQEEMSRLFGELGPDGETRAYPAVNVFSGKESVTVQAELPGFDPAKIDISVLGNTLTLAGKREPEALAEGDACHRRERTSGEFLRTIELPHRVDAEQVEARYAHGVLEVRLPRLAEDRPRQIAVQSN